MHLHPGDGYLTVYALGTIGEDELRKIATVGGSSCLDCNVALKEGDLVTLVRDIYGVAWVHDACIREEVS